MVLYCFVYFAYLSLGVGSLKLASCTGMIECDKLIFYFLQHIYVKIGDFSLSFVMAVTQCGLRVQKLYCWQDTSLIYTALLDGVL